MVHNLLLLALAAEALVVHYIKPTEDGTVVVDTMSSTTDSIDSATTTTTFKWTPDQVDDACMYGYGLLLLTVNGVFFGVGTRLYNAPEMREAGLST
jgi:hypothetical protein